MIEVCTGLIIAVFALLGMSHDWVRDDSGTSADPAGGGERER